MKTCGFTLIELLVAIFIFAIMAALAYGGYNVSSRQSALTRESMDRLMRVQTAIRLLTQDFEQLAPRPVRDVMGELQVPALQTSDGGTPVVTLTRNGWTNPAGLPRPALQRVAYVLDDNTLRREHWTVLDATLANGVVKRELLDRVEALEIRFLTGGDQWQVQWPPLGAPPEITGRMRPLAVEIKLKLEDYGEITRLVEVGG
jgi:general secretion pathway protein J